MEAKTVQHRGFTITLQYAQALGGWSQWYFTITRDYDTWEAFTDHSESVDTEETMIDMLKERIDNEIQDGRWVIDEQQVWVNRRGFELEICFINWDTREVDVVYLNSAAERILKVESFDGKKYRLKHASGRWGHHSPENLLLAS